MTQKAVVSGIVSTRLYRDPYGFQPDYLHIQMGNESVI